VTNDLYLSPVPESRAELRPWQSTEAGTVRGIDSAKTVLAGVGFAGEAGFGGLTEVQAVSPPCTEMPPRAGNEPEWITARDGFPAVALFIAVRGTPWSSCGAPTRTGLAVRS
jgi:hypothetical protein